MAPKYLSSLVKLRSVSRYSVRLDNDYYLLENVYLNNIKRTEGAFSFQAPRIWNQLPYEVRSMSELSLFKSKLKTHYFKIAFNEIDALEGS